MLWDIGILCAHWPGDICSLIGWFLVCPGAVASTWWLWWFGADSYRTHLEFTIIISACPNQFTLVPIGECFAVEVPLLDNLVAEVVCEFKFHSSWYLISQIRLYRSWLNVVQNRSRIGLLNEPTTFIFVIVRSDNGILKVVVFIGSSDVLIAFFRFLNSKMFSITFVYCFIV